MVNILKFLLLILIPSLVFAQNSGVSYIGIKHKSWPCDLSLKVFSKAPVARLGFLIDGTFGDSLACAEKVLKLNKPKVIRVHLANCTCFPERGRTCQKEEVFYGLNQKQANQKIKAKDKKLLDKIRVRAAQAKAYLSKNENGPIDFYVSPCMESGLDGPARQVMLNLANEYFPKATLVDNAFGRPVIPGYIPEIHGAGSYNHVPYIIDNDGSPFTKIKDLPKFYGNNTKAISTLLWDLFMNCIDPHVEGFVPPRQRSCKKGWPLFDYLRELLAPNGMVKPLPEAFNQQDLRGLKVQGVGYLLKQSDTHHGLAFLTKTNLNNPTFVKNGQKIDTLRYTGSRENGDRIYRASKAAWEVPQAIILKAGKIGFKLQYPMWRIEK